MRHYHSLTIFIRNQMKLIGVTARVFFTILLIIFGGVYFFPRSGIVPVNAQTPLPTDQPPGTSCPGGTSPIFKGPGPYNIAFNGTVRSEEHTSELQSQFHLVC